MKSFLSYKVHCPVTLINRHQSHSSSATMWDAPEKCLSKSDFLKIRACNICKIFNYGIGILIS